MKYLLLLITLIMSFFSNVQAQDVQYGGQAWVSTTGGRTLNTVSRGSTSLEGAKSFLENNLKNLLREGERFNGTPSYDIEKDDENAYVDYYGQAFSTISFGNDQRKNIEIRLKYDYSPEQSFMRKGLARVKLFEKLEEERKKYGGEYTSKVYFALQDVRAREESKTRTGNASGNNANNNTIALAEATSQLFSSIREEDETLCGLGLSYYSIKDMWKNYSLSFNPTHYWGNFFLQWGFTANYSRGNMWVAEKQEGIDYGRGTRTVSHKEFNERFGNGFQTGQDEALFYKQGDSFTEYAYYRHQSFEDWGGGMTLGIGVRIPIGNGSVGIPLGAGGFGNLSSKTSNYGYQLFGGIDIGKVYLRVSSMHGGRKNTNFTHSVFQKHATHSGNNVFRTLEPFGKMKEDSRKLSMIQFSLGIYL